MTKFLNESGFRRIIKTIKNALAGKQDKKLVVTVTGIGGDNITADKTYNEILAAYNSGADVLVDDGSGYFYHLIAFDSGWFVFMMKPYDETNTDYYLLVSSQNVWTSRTWVAQEKLTSGTNIKTVAGNSLLGSGNVTLNDSDIYHSGEDGEDGNYMDDGDTVDVCLNNLDTAVASKQNTLVSGTNIKTINNTSLLGSGNITLTASDIDEANGDTIQDSLDSLVNGKQDTLVSGRNIKTINNKSVLASGNMDLSPYTEYANENELLADTTQRNGTIGFEYSTHKFFIYHATFQEWLMLVQGRAASNTFFEYAFDLVFTQ